MDRLEKEGQELETRGGSGTGLMETNKAAMMTRYGRCQEFGRAGKDCPNKAKANVAESGSPPPPTAAATTAALAATGQSSERSRTLDSLKKTFAFQAITGHAELEG